MKLAVWKILHFKIQRKTQSYNPESIFYCQNKMENSADVGYTWWVEICIRDKKYSSDIHNTAYIYWRKRISLAINYHKSPKWHIKFRTYDFIQIPKASQVFYNLIFRILVIAYKMVKWEFCIKRNIHLPYFPLFLY